jgi:hypothetical protein
MNKNIFIMVNGNGEMSAFEYKWDSKIPRVPAAFSKAYPQAIYEVINRDNYLGGFL